MLFNLKSIELAWVFSSYAGVFLLHTFQRSVPITRPSFKFRKYITLLCHLSIPIAEISRFHLRAVYQQPVPTVSDFGLCIAHSITALILTSRLRVGDRSIARPSYQAITSIRLCLSAIAYLTGDPFLYRASIRIINGFVYPRIGIKVLGRMKVLPSYSAVYTASNFIASVVSIHETQLALAPHIFLLTFVAILNLNRWVAWHVQEP
ncbi:hypothetical protein Micbo1qcDRAFT_128476 [Microdochium bolleyi]|uniref:Uncharacterized protein n=1 Tax=Microdochium bolleyi TaxID=196109 RepID=A0A136IJL8_9PEZI|nr:hypothetical protein Micbo1qcDRAFT_128476 [Microdochium bolleyi]